ncbi:MAG: hypothetical protein HY925_08575 [Elusimicrobia bacterium]|nr:hypothetical protein [Elusimicrobiota bacterium]
MIFALLQVLSLPLLAAPKDEYGVVSAIQFFQDEKKTPGLTKLSELGVGWVRTDLTWDVVQHNAPTASSENFDFSFTDKMIKNAHEKGLKVFASLGGPPAWAAPCQACLPKDMKAWSKFVRRTIERYAWLGDDIAFGIWNEPNDTYFLSEDGKAFKSNSHAYSDPELYAALFNAAAKARGLANPSARLGALEATDAVFSGGPWWKFWERAIWFDEAWPLIEKSLKPQDFVTLHYYPEKGWTQEEMYAFMGKADKGTGGRETWLTESPGDELPRLVQAFAARPSKNWKRIFVYRIWGGDDDRFSLLKADWTDRPGFKAYRDFILGRKNGAVIVSVKGPPAEMKAGERASVSVKVRNTGKTAWTESYKLGSQSPADNAVWRKGRVPVAGKVEPGAEHTFSWTVTAPSKAGTYSFQWRMVQEKVEWFGKPTELSRTVVR